MPRVMKANPADVNAGRNLDLFMARLGMTQTDLANATGIHQTTISRLVSGNQRWTLSTTRELAKAVRVHPAQFLRDYDEILHEMDSLLGSSGEPSLPAGWGYAA